MTKQDLIDEVKGLKKDYKEVYDSIISFADYLLERKFKINGVNTSFKSCSTYVDFESLDFEDELVTVRFSNHTANGNYGTTDVYFGSHLTLEENYESVIEILEER